MQQNRSMIKKAMIMAAGAGTRLGMLSDIVPKPLVPLANIPVIDIILRHLASFGIKDVIANTFYKAEMIQDRCKNNKFGINFDYIQETELSGTAGGLKKCSFFFKDEEDFIVMSGDGLSDVNINEAYSSFKNSGAIAEIIVKEVKHEEVSKYGIIVPDEKGFIKSFQEKPEIDKAASNLANTGIYIFNRRIFDYIPENTFYDFAKNVFPELLKNNQKIKIYNHKGYWSDIGSIEQYKKSNMDILKEIIPSILPDSVKTKEGRYIKGENTYIDKSAVFKGSSVIGRNCLIGKNSEIQNSILWDNVKIADDVKIENSIILSNSVVSLPVKNEIVLQHKKGN